VQARAAHAHAISNPTLADIEKRWEAMPPQEQADLWMSLRDRMKVNWSELTHQEKKAGAYIYISFLSVPIQRESNCVRWRRENIGVGIACKRCVY
jgi:hypothetical protein